MDLGLLSERQLREVRAALGTRDAPLEDFEQLVIRREYMTNYQVERVRKGERSGFFYGPYKVLYLVGAGSFARVFRAVHKTTNEVVALKVLRSRYSENPDQYGQFVREGRVGVTLRHPNIVPIYDVVSEGKNHYLVMEFVEGWNLRDFVKIRKKVDASEAVKLMLGITDGLRYAFEQGLGHRDLKMNNVLVSSSKQPKLVDFGLAAIDESTVSNDDLMGEAPNARAIDYAALERATGVRKDDSRSDIYFLGCIFYHMLTGQAPLNETKDRLQRLNKARFLEVIPIQTLDPIIPHWVSIVVNKAMTLDPSRRYQTPAIMLTDLRLADKQLAQGGAKAGATAAATEKQYSVMLVESNQERQEVLREGLKKAGYRVLLTSDPTRAVARFRQEPTAADCVVFNAETLGESALEMFNELGEDKKAHFVRAVLLLDERQKDWANHAVTADHRVVLNMPLTMKQLRLAVAALVGMKVKGG